jgi:hypothetical protein
VRIGTGLGRLTSRCTGRRLSAQTPSGPGGLHGGEPGSHILAGRLVAHAAVARAAQIIASWTLPTSADGGTGNRGSADSVDVDAITGVPTGLLPLGPIAETIADRTAVGVIQQL